MNITRWSLALQDALDRLKHADIACDQKAQQSVLETLGKASELFAHSGRFSGPELAQINNVLFQASCCRCCCVDRTMLYGKSHRSELQVIQWTRLAISGEPRVLEGDTAAAVVAVSNQLVPRRLCCLEGLNPCLRQFWQPAGFADGLPGLLLRSVQAHLRPADRRE